MFKRTRNLAATTRKVDGLYSPYRDRRAGTALHAVFQDFCARCARDSNCRVLELGSRQLGTISRRSSFATAAQYVGFDIHPGPGVDVVGDAHELGRFFAPASFDAVFSFSLFEHLAFPWKVVLETNRVLRPGGVCFVSTHPVWPAHELPWDFWRFPVAGLRLLFSAPTGFRIVQANEGLFAKLHSLADDEPTRNVSTDCVTLGVAVLAEKVADYDADRLRWDVPLSSVLTDAYPAPGGPAAPAP